MATDGTDVVNLTSTAGNDQDATWLPIGGGVVFVSDRDGPNQIYRMEGDGGGQRRLMESTSQDGVPDGR
jgi:TolB protein